MLLLLFLKYGSCFRDVEIDIKWLPRYVKAEINSNSKWYQFRGEMVSTADSNSWVIQGEKKRRNRNKSRANLQETKSRDNPLGPLGPKGLSGESLGHFFICSAWVSCSFHLSLFLAFHSSLTHLCNSCSTTCRSSIIWLHKLMSLSKLRWHLNQSFTHVSSASTLAQDHCCTSSLVGILLVNKQISKMHPFVKSWSEWMNLEERFTQLTKDETQSGSNVRIIKMVDEWDGPSLMIMTIHINTVQY